MRKKPVNSVPGEFTGKKKRARDGTRTRGPDLGKVVLHQLSHSRIYEMFMYLFARNIWYLTMEKDNCQLFFAKAGTHK